MTEYEITIAGLRAKAQAILSGEPTDCLTAADQLAGALLERDAEVRRLKHYLQIGLSPDTAAKEGLTPDQFVERFRARFEPWTAAPQGPEYGLLVRATAADRGSAAVPGFFRHPTQGYVEDFNFSDTPGARGGIYGLLDGIGDWGLIPQDRDPPPVWQVLKVKRSEAVQSDPAEDGYGNVVSFGSVRVPRAWVIYTGTAGRAVSFIFETMHARIREGAPCPLQHYRNEDGRFNELAH